MTSSEPAIHRAARQGDIAMLERLIAEGTDINLRFDADLEHGSPLRQLTPLMSAARSLDGATEETLAWLLAHGANLHAVSGGGVTAAWYAAGKGGGWWFDPWHKVPSHAARLSYLLDAGLDPHEASCTGRSLLAEACFAGDPIAVKLLLERGVSHEPVAGWVEEGNDFFTEPQRPPVPRPDGGFYRDQIPLFGAVESGSVECVQLLLAKNARLDYTDDYDYDILDVALTQEDHYRPGSKKPSTSYVTIAKRLLTAGVPLDRINTSGQSRLYWIAFCQQEYGVRFLLEQGASRAGDDRGCTPLYAICWHAETPPITAITVQEPIIRMLAAAGVPLETPECSALHTAIYGDVPNPNTVRILLELGANPEERGGDGTRPLHWAVGEHSVESVRLLLQHGADPLHPSHSGETPLARAQRVLQKQEEWAREDPEWQWVADQAEAVLALLEAAVAGIEQNGDGRR